MKVQLFEPFAGWHHTKYIATLLPTLIALKDAGKIDEIVVVTTHSHVRSPHFADQLAAFTGTVRFDAANLPRRWPASVAISEMLDRSIRKHRPDFLVSTSANDGGFPTALRSMMHARTLTSVGIFHNGYTKRPVSPRQFIHDYVQKFARDHAPWSELHVVNPLLYDTIKAKGGHAADRLKLLPDPVFVRKPMEKAAARAYFKLPAGTIIGMVGQMDKRKAVPDLVRAFRSLEHSEANYLLLAGRLARTYRRLIDREFGDLVRENRIILIDRYLTPEELHCATSACDAVAITYYTDELSGNLLAAIAAGRPVLASSEGYTGMIIERFGVGWACSVRNSPSFRSALQSAYRESGSFIMPDTARYLLLFHDPQNFVDTVLAQLYALIDIDLPATQSWRSVVAQSTGNE
jgi:glycosyltransferase involved in cell wall biosynthesis